MIHPGYDSWRWVICTVESGSGSFRFSFYLKEIWSRRIFSFWSEVSWSYFCLSSMKRSSDSSAFLEFWLAFNLTHIYTLLKRSKRVERWRFVEILRWPTYINQRNRINQFGSFQPCTSVRAIYPWWCMDLEWRDSSKDEGYVYLEWNPRIWPRIFHKNIRQVEMSSNKKTG